jgi:hypothetical protein
MFTLGLSINSYLKNTYRLEKGELDFIKKLIDLMSVKNKEGFAKNVKIMDAYFKKYVKYLTVNNVEAKQRDEELFTLLNIRSKVERYMLNTKNAISDITQLKRGERIVVYLPNKYFFKSIIGQSSRGGFICSYPVDDPELDKISWKNLTSKFFFTKKDDALYSFDASIVSNHPKGQASFLKVRGPKAIYKRQRRVYPRVNTSIPGIAFSVTVLEKGKRWRLKVDETRKILMNIKNISAGGFMIHTNAVYEPGEYVKISFPFFGKEEVILAEVVNSKADPSINQNIVNLKSIKQQLSTKLNILLFTFGYISDEKTERVISPEE